MLYYVYILLCKDGSYYTGYAKDMKSRLEQHRKGQGARYTRMHKPDRVVYVEDFGSRKEAMERERQIKKLSHRQKKQLINSRCDTSYLLEYNPTSCP